MWPAATEHCAPALFALVEYDCMKYEIMSYHAHYKLQRYYYYFCYVAAFLSWVQQKACGIEQKLDPHKVAEVIL